MESTTSFLIVVLGYLTFGISAIIWISKKKKAGEKVSLLVKIIIAGVILSSSSILLSMISQPPAPETSVSEAKTYYVKTGSANVRECPSTSCKIIDSLSQNEKLTFPGDLYGKYPDWAEITFPNGQLGYVSKTTLSENLVLERQLTPTDDSSSIGGITVGPWNNIQTVIGESYEFPFCEPPSAISGATCGALADKTTDPRGGTPPYSFIKKSGFLPPGMTLELNGTLRGAPTQTGTYNFRLCAKDLYGGEGCQNIVVVVKKSGTAVVSPPVQPANGNYKAVLSFTADMQNYEHSDSVLENSEHISVTITVERPAQAEQGNESSASYSFSSTGRANPYKSSNCVSQYGGTFGNNMGFSGVGSILGYLPSRPLRFTAGTGYTGDYRDFDYTPSSVEFCATWPPDVVIREILSDIIYGTGGGVALKERDLNPAGETISFSNDYRPEHLATDRITYSGTLIFTTE